VGVRDWSLLLGEGHGSVRLRLVNKGIISKSAKTMGHL